MFARRRLVVRRHIDAVHGLIQCGCFFGIVNLGVPQRLKFVNRKRTIIIRNAVCAGHQFDDSIDQRLHFGNCVGLIARH